MNYTIYDAVKVVTPTVRSDHRAVIAYRHPALPTKQDPTVKAILRRKNRLMHAGRMEEAYAMAIRVRKAITRHSTKWLRGIDAKKNAKPVPGPKYAKLPSAKVEKTVSLRAASLLR